MTCPFHGSCHGRIPAVALTVGMHPRRRLEYRGYDSAGVAVIESKGDMCMKKKVRTALGNLAGGEAQERG